MLSGALSRRAVLGAALPMAGRVERQFLFGSACSLQLPGGGASAALWSRLRWLDANWNAWKPGVLSRVHSAWQAGLPAAVPADLAALLRTATQLESISDGCFNAGLGALVGAWGFHADRLGDGPAPAPDWLRRWAGAVPGLRALQWRGGGVFSPDPALRLDLGGIAKGWAVDEALTALQASGVRDALLDLGGNLAAMGRGSEGPWRVGIRDPFSPGLVALLRTQGREAVVTSGTYERWRRLADGGIATHVLDPHAARPAQALVSVTVVHPSATWADATATALLVAGPGRWRALAARLGLDQVLVIGPDGQAQAHARLAQRLRFVDDTRGRALRVV